MSDYQEITELPADPIQPGFYYHYKHDPNGPFNNYAYQVLGIIRHTENKTLLMVYRPLYENTYLDVNFSGRPLEMAMSSVEINGEVISRFRRIEDSELIGKLQEIKVQMYPDAA